MVTVITRRLEATIRDMSENSNERTFEPNTVRASGSQSFEHVGLEATVGETGVKIHTRDGMDRNTIRLSYDEISAIERVENLSYGIRIATDDTRYELTNIGPDKSLIDSIVEALQSKINTQPDT